VKRRQQRNKAFRARVRRRVGERRPGLDRFDQERPERHVDGQHCGSVFRLPASKRSGLVRNARAVRADLEHGRAAIGDTADDGGHAPALDEVAPLEVPALGEPPQHGGQLVEPGVDRPAETRAQFLVELWSGRGPQAAARTASS
jgi:hypothetical protein